MRAVARAVALVVLAMAYASCGGGGFFGPDYEYEEEVYLATDGSAVVVINASIESMAVLRGLSLDTANGAEVDRDRIRAFYTSPATRVTRVSRPWRRHGRSFVQVRVETDDITTLHTSKPFAWSSYEVERSGGGERGGEIITYRQRLSRRETSRASTPPWTGQELVAVRLHLPSRVVFHNAPSRQVERGNILRWEQPLQDRLNGEPLDIEVRINSQTILYRTLGIFAAALLAAVVVLAGAAYWVWSLGRKRSKLSASRAG